MLKINKYIYKFMKTSSPFWMTTAEHMVSHVYRDYFFEWVDKLSRWVFMFSFFSIYNITYLRKNNALCHLSTYKWKTFHSQFYIYFIKAICLLTPKNDISQVIFILILDFSKKYISIFYNNINTYFQLSL